MSLSSSSSTIYFYVIVICIVDVGDLRRHRRHIAFHRMSTFDILVIDVVMYTSSRVRSAAWSSSFFWVPGIYYVRHWRSCSFRSYAACIFVPLRARVTARHNYYKAVVIPVLSCGGIKRVKPEGDCVNACLWTTLAVIVVSALASLPFLCSTISGLWCVADVVVHAFVMTLVVVDVIGYGVVIIDVIVLCSSLWRRWLVVSCQWRYWLVAFGVFLLSPSTFL